MYFRTGIHDGGRYSCEIETDTAEPLAVVHIVEILGKLSAQFCENSILNTVQKLSTMEFAFLKLISY
jgi:hypothetical protein